MTRPKKDPIERLKVKYMLHFIARINDLRLTGYALEKHFEPENIKISPNTGQLYDSGKWRRFLKHGITPSKKSMSRIKEHCPSALKTYHSPFWQALTLIERDEDQWHEFYNSLNKNVSTIVLDYIENPRLFDERMNEVNKPLKKLIRIGDDHAVAALIALFRQYSEPVLINDDIETHLYNVFFNFLSRFCPHSFLPELYTYVYDNIFQRQILRARASTWPDSVEVVEYMLSIEQKNEMMAEDLMIIDRHTTAREFFYWKYRGNKPIIIQEMAEAFNHEKWKLPDSNQGLKWLLKALNKSRPKKHKFGEVYF